MSGSKLFLRVQQVELPARLCHVSVRSLLGASVTWIVGSSRSSSSTAGNSNQRHFSTASWLQPAVSSHLQRGAQIFDGHSLSDRPAAWCCECHSC